jgi:hypothetical protein
MEKRVKRNLIPYSVYLREDQIARLRSLAEGRRASDLIRRALDTIDERGDDFNSGVRVGLASAVEIVRNSKHGAIRFPNGQTISDMIIDELRIFMEKRT